MFRCLTLFLSLLLIFAAVPALAQGSDDTTPPAPGGNSVSDESVTPMHRIVPWRNPDANGAVELSAPAGAHLSYFGGPVISNVRVVQVLYGSGFYDAQVAGTGTPNMGTFYSVITNSGYMDLLSQYNTPASGGTNQTIGHGGFDGLFEIVPSAANNGSVISDAQIQSELLAQITTGHLPMPSLDAMGNVNTIYMLFFPPGKTITLGRSLSCVDFCAYHGTTSSTFSLRHVLYGVHPDMQTGGCAVGCGSSSTFNNYTSVTSHELAETITDAQVGLATTFASPLAWYDSITNGEIGDLCNGQQGSFVVNGITYVIQLEFSNAANNCVLPPDTPTFSLAALFNSLALVQGGAGSSIVTVSPSVDFVGSVTLSAFGLPFGVTASFSANPITSTSEVTFAASTAATVGNANVTIQGTSQGLTRTTTIALAIAAPATPTTEAAPLTVTFLHGADLDHWDFGDGQVSSQKSIVHTYQAAGTYTATPFYRNVVITRSVPPVTHVTITAGPPVVITVF